VFICLRPGHTLFGTVDRSQSFVCVIQYIFEAAFAFAKRLEHIAQLIIQASNLSYELFDAALSPLMRASCMQRAC